MEYRSVTYNGHQKHSLYTFQCPYQPLVSQKIETTMTYLKDAKYYYEQTPYDWIQRAITKKSWWKKHNAKTGEIQKTALTD